VVDACAADLHRQLDRLSAIVRGWRHMLPNKVHSRAPSRTISRQLAMGHWSKWLHGDWVGSAPDICERPRNRQPQYAHPPGQKTAGDPGRATRSCWGATFEGSTKVWSQPRPEPLPGGRDPPAARTRQHVRQGKKWSRVRSTRVIVPCIGHGTWASLIPGIDERRPSGLNRWSHGCCCRGR